MVVLELLMMMKLLLLLLLHKHERMDAVGQIKGKEEGVAFCGASRDEKRGVASLLILAAPLVTRCHAFLDVSDSAPALFSPCFPWSSLPPSSQLGSSRYA